MEYFKSLFRGRISRRNYIRGCLFLFMFMLTLGLFCYFIFPEKSLVVYIITWVCGIIVVILWESLYVRRSHDLGKNGWYYVIEFMERMDLELRKGQVEANQFGEKPSGDLNFIDALFNLKPGSIISQFTNSLIRSSYYELFSLTVGMIIFAGLELYGGVGGAAERMSMFFARTTLLSMVLFLCPVILILYKALFGQSRISLKEISAFMRLKMGMIKDEKNPRHRARLVLALAGRIVIIVIAAATIVFGATRFYHTHLGHSIFLD